MNRISWLGRVQGEQRYGVKRIIKRAYAKKGLKVGVALSGGVDSAVCAYLLKEQGYEVTGYHMTNWSIVDEQGHCSANDDLKSAKLVAKYLDIDFKHVNFEKEYWNDVFEPYIQILQTGIFTPNTDFKCNVRIKFGALFNTVIKDNDYLATGHYARTREIDGKFNLVKGLDPAKDQTYFLSGINGVVLDRVLFPLGGMYKKDVKLLAEEIKLPNSGRKESMGLCYVGKRDFKSFLKDFMEVDPGLIITTEGVNIGEHKGVGFYTIGQNITDDNLKYNDRRWYVVAKEPKTKVITVTDDKNDPYLLYTSIFVKHLHWISGDIPKSLSEGKPFLCQATIRYHETEKNQKCTIIPMDESDEFKYKIDLSTPRKAVAPGQIICLSINDVILGSGIIMNAE